MAEWSELPRDLLRVIINRLSSVSDQIRFRWVCSSWRSVAVETKIHLLGLMIPGRRTTSRKRRFLTFPECRVVKHLPLRVPHTELCRGSHQGWLVMANNERDMYLLNPFSDSPRIDLPHMNTLPERPEDYLPRHVWRINKAIISSNPGVIPNSDCMVLVIYEGGELAFCKVGDKAWTAIESPMHINDAMYYQGKFYVVHYSGATFACDLSTPCPKLVQVAPSLPSRRPFYKKWYLVESGGKILLVLRIRVLDYDINLDYYISSEEEDQDVDDHGDRDDEIDDYSYRTIKFKIYTLDTSSQKWIRTKSLGDCTLFVGLNNSFSLSRPEIFGCKGNCIYFTDDNVHGHLLKYRPGYDMGIFHMEDYVIGRLYQTGSELTRFMPPSIWVTPINPWEKAPTT